MARGIIPPDEQFCLPRELYHRYTVPDTSAEISRRIRLTRLFPKKYVKEIYNRSHVELGGSRSDSWTLGLVEFGEARADEAPRVLLRTALYAPLVLWK